MPYFKNERFLFTKITDTCLNIFPHLTFEKNSRSRESCIVVYISTRGDIFIYTFDKLWTNDIEIRKGSNNIESAVFNIENFILRLKTKIRNLLRKNKTHPIILLVYPGKYSKYYYETLSRRLEYKGIKSEAFSDASLNTILVNPA